MKYGGKTRFAIQNFQSSLGGIKNWSICPSYKSLKLECDTEHFPHGFV